MVKIFQKNFFRIYLIKLFNIHRGYNVSQLLTEIDIFGTSSPNYRYGSHPWFLIIGDWSYRGRYTADGIWGVALGVIGAILGISAGCVSDYGTFRGLYIAQSVFVSIVAIQSYDDFKQ